MAIIDRKEVERVARLARLALGEDEITAIQEQIGAMLENAKILSEVNTDGVEPMPYAVSSTNVLRADENRPSMPREQALANAPEARDGYFYVPRILDE